MNRPPSHWSESDLAEPLMRVLDSAASPDSDNAALGRVCARLETALGAQLDVRPAEPAPWHISASQLRRFVAAGALTLAAVSFPWGELRPRPVPSQAITSVPQPTAADVRAGEQAPLPQDLAPDHPTEVSNGSPRAAQSRRHPNPPKAPGLAEELNGLAQIRALLKTSPQRALAAADEQQRRFARGALTPERELLRLDALLRLGHMTQAKRFAAQLTAAPENQAYTARIRELLAGARSVSAAP